MRILGITVCCHSSFWMLVLHWKAYILIHQDHKVPGSAAQLLVPLDHKVPGPEAQLLDHRVPGSNAQLLVSSHGANLQVPKAACILHHT